MSTTSTGSDAAPAAISTPCANGNIFGEQTFLVVFDFDHTILDCNSDVNIPHHLGRAALQEQLIKLKLQWTNLISALLAPFAKEQIADAARTSVVVHPGVIALMRFLMDLQEATRRDGSQEIAPFLEVCIASDANHLFIQEIFAEHFPFLKVTSVHTNDYHDLRGTEREGEPCDETGETRLSKLSWYEPAPGHNCRLCCFRGRPHMCKSRIIHRCLHNSKLIDPTVIFVGDGGNDYCPVINCLRPRDFVFARSGFPLANDLALRKGGCCHVELWQDGDALHKVFQRVLLQGSYRLPTLVKFADAPQDEFRHHTLLRRMSAVISEVLQRNEGKLSAAVVTALQELATSLSTNGAQAVVPPLPGQTSVAPWISNYRAVAIDGDASLTAVCDGSKPTRWGQLPWLHGEIYFYALLVHLIHLEHSGEALVTPYVYVSPIVAATEHEEHTTRQRVTDSEDLHLSHVNKEPGDIDHPAHSAVPSSFEHQYFDASFLLRETNGTVNPESTAPAYDIFRAEKKASFAKYLQTTIVPHVELGLYRPLPPNASTVDARKERLRYLILSMLWGNAVDLSFRRAEDHDPAHSVSSIRFPPESNIIGNHVDAIVERIEKTFFNVDRECHVTKHLDVVLDNTGVELVADLIFAAFVLSSTEHVVITLHGKPSPFYVSDVTSLDLDDTFEGLRSAGTMANELATLILHHLSQTQRLRFAADPCWVSPLEYRELPPTVVNTFFFTQSLVVPVDEPDALHPAGHSLKRFPKTSMVIFKGDLNFRRLVGDRHWDKRSFYAATKAVVGHDAADDEMALASHVTRRSTCGRIPPSLDSAISDYWPCSTVPVVALRTCKSEVCCGVPIETVDSLDRDPKTAATWRVSGAYAVALITAE